MQQQQQESGGEESWLEEQFLREINGQNDEYEREFVRQRDNNLSTVWGAFQDSATAVAQLYRERSSNTYASETGALWLPFQTAAGTVTTLYKESCDGLKRTSDAAIQCGYQRRTRELADWARSKKRRMIRREDLLAFLAGKPLPMQSTNPHANRRSPKPEHNNHHGGQVSGGGGGANGVTGFASNGLNMMAPTNTNGGQTAATAAHLLNNPASGQVATVGATGGALGAASGIVGDDLHTFKEALVLRPRGPELFAFVANEIARHCKRPGSPIDDKMDICHYSSKRQRFM
ncbi:HUWE1-associated protein modifying stress responses [Drosophila albomicans]|uniref:HUWE1-associated protein modifying stress responses n=1 Tax=Drosophila albomicans TaxID=7291 RepID=A0A6P8XFV3_DROAB|nr:HUWE1-associated protein modifying stress responses [Drosophila albomicans]